VPDPNVGKVIYSSYEIDAWYHSPYPYEFGAFIDRLYICEYCLKYMNKETQLAHHKVVASFRLTNSLILNAILDIV
jgi:hypothetical protein